METEDDCVRPKHSTRIVKPPRWHQDYVIAQSNLSGQLSQEPKDVSQQVTSQGASITATQNEVKSLSEEIKQIKGNVVGCGTNDEGYECI